MEALRWISLRRSSMVIQSSDGGVKGQHGQGGGGGEHSSIASAKKDAASIVVQHIEQLSLVDSDSDSDSEPELFRAYSNEAAEGNGRQRRPRYAALDDFNFLKTGSGSGNGELKIVTDGGPGERRVASSGTRVAYGDAYP